MHIVHLCSEYPPARHGGVGSFTRSLAELLADRPGWRVSIVGSYLDGSGDWDEQNGVHVLRLRRTVRRGGALLDARKMWSAVRALHEREPVDVVEGAELAFWAGPSSSEFRRVIRMHGGHHYFSQVERPAPRRSTAWIERRSFARATDLAAVSRYVADDTRRLLGDDRTVTVIPNFVDTDEFRPGDVDPAPDTIAYIGTVCEKKGFRQLVRALPAVVAERPGTRLVVAGRDTVVDGRSFLQAALDEVPPAIADRVTALGMVDRDTELPGVLDGAAVCAFPAYLEAMPMAWLEAMARGKALVASTLGPGPEMLTSGVDALLADPDDVASLAQQLVTLLGDRSMQVRLGAAARATAVDRYSIPVAQAANVAFYESLVRR